MTLAPQDLYGALSSINSVFVLQSVYNPLRFDKRYFSYLINYRLIVKKKLKTLVENYQNFQIGLNHFYSV